MRCSFRKRARIVSPSIPYRISFSAKKARRPSTSRQARKTTPIPPRPISSART
jgi:hypothetical protein